MADAFNADNIDGGPAAGFLSQGEKPARRSAWKVKDAPFCLARRLLWVMFIAAGFRDDRP